MRPKPSTLGVWVCAAVWSAFSAALGAAGSEPRGLLLPIPAAQYYYVQAALLPFYLPAMWWACAAASRGVAGRFGVEASPQVFREALGPPLALSLLITLLLPEISAFAISGLPGIKKVAPIAGSLCMFVAWGSCALSLARIEGLGLWRGLWVAGAGLFTLVLVAVPVLR